MQPLWTLLFVILLAGTAFATDPVKDNVNYHVGSTLLIDHITTLPTDAAADVSSGILGTRGYAGIRGTVKCDKAGTLVIYPIHESGDTTRGGVSTTLAVSVNTATEFGYDNIGAYAAEVVFTKTGAGDATSFEMTVRGTLQN